MCMLRMISALYLSPKSSHRTTMTSYSTSDGLRLVAVYMWQLVLPISTHSWHMSKSWFSPLTSIWKGISVYLSGSSTHFEACGELSAYAAHILVHAQANAIAWDMTGSHNGQVQYHSCISLSLPAKNF